MDKIKDLGFAKLDLSRSERTGQSETVFCPGKTSEQLAAILLAFQEENIPVLGTKCSAEQAEFLAEKQIPVTYDPTSKILSSNWGARPLLKGKIAVCTGGTADIPAAEEAAKTIEFFGAEVDRHYDVGVAGLHRLLARVDQIREADIVIAAAGMEGALGSVIAGLTDAPVIAIPTSVGYGASFEGIAPLLAMLNSCAEGMSVVNIDNGFGAGVLACRILRMKGRNR
ncbi:MAG: nickel pincer cofactor biosynthesis protein LarB [Lentisphaeria bacterium]|nr:nickel pincer cofactor biosynthesis protein LarB [Lentisphaeria bacterium]